MKKTFLSILFVLALCLCLSPMALAAPAGTDLSIYDFTTNGYTLTGSDDAENPSVYHLGDDVTIDTTITVTGYVTLDLNGHVLKMTGDGSVIKVGDDSTSATGNLTLIDSGSSAEHKFTEDSSTHLWALNASGDKTVLGGVITGGNASTTNNSYGGGVWVSNGTFTMQGGNIVGCKADMGGGGVYTTGSSTAAMSGGTINGCTAANNGGGVFVHSTSTSQGNFTMEAGTIQSCTAKQGGGVCVNSNGTFAMSGGTIESCKTDGTVHQSGGGGVYTSGTFTMSGGTIKNCTAPRADSNSQNGGVYVNSTVVDAFTMSGGTIENCAAATAGGGVYVTTGDSSTSANVFKMTGGTIQSCTAYVEGGGVYITGRAIFTMSGGTIDSCTAPNSNACGGGVYVNGNATFRMETNSSVGPATTGTIQSCTAKQGGGVYVYSYSGKCATFTMEGGTIQSCTATGTNGKGGGVYVSGSSTFTMSGGTIQSCTATGSGGGVYTNGTSKLQGGTIQNNTATTSGGGVFVCAGKTLTVGGDSSPANVTINGNKQGTDTPDNVYLDDSTAKITAGANLLKSESQVYVTRKDDPTVVNRRYIGALALDPDTSSGGGVGSGDGYTWSHTNMTLLLYDNTLADSITLPNADTTIEIRGDVIVKSIGNVYLDKTLTIEGTDGTNPNLTVTDTVNANEGTLTIKDLTATIDTIKRMNYDEKLILENANVTANSVMWNHSGSTVNGLELTGSTLTIPAGGSGICAGQIKLNDYDSKIHLNDGNISTNNEGNLQSPNVLLYCPSDGTYSIGDPAGAGVTYYLLKDGATATNITLQRTAPSTPSAPSGPTYYRVTVSEPVNGTVEASATRATRGTTITVTTAAASGYGLETLTVLDRNNREVALTDLGGGKYTFKMPSSNVTVSAYFTLLPNFDDVDPGDYFYDPVRWAVNNGITNGIGGGKFGPDLGCTRAQIVTFLYRCAIANGIDVSVGEDTNILSYIDALDVPEYAVEAFQWAVGAGIIQGADGKLMPNDDCTRAQIVTMLYRYKAANGMSAVTLQELVGGYGDAAQVPSYALAPFNWALAKGIVQGYNGNLMPNDTCTRGQIVTMLYRLLGTN